MADSSQTIGKQITFCALFKEFGRVQIPIIQRDYAQGRPGHEDLRGEFLAALKNALSKDDDDPTLPLDLDFVYGSGFRSDGGSEKYDSFSPLDGQQRLTTLFLLHWYLAWKDGKTEDFQSRFVRDRNSLVDYEVRPSSHDFFNRLAEHFPNESLKEVRKVSDTIQDEAWFFRSWNNDPTIVSALTMLNSMHEHFSRSVGYYERITDSEHPRITFQLLELRNFGLSDDLYIKMNARGKPLTAFESFKARLEQHLCDLLPDDRRELHGRNVTAREYFSYKMDTEWANLFWNHRSSKTDLFDDNIMRLIKAVSLVCLDTEAERVIPTLNTLRSMKDDVSFAKYHDFGCLNRRMLKTLMALLDYWAQTGIDDEREEITAYYDSSAAFVRATTGNLTYPELVKFGAFATFVENKGVKQVEELKQWLRVINNLVENSDIERASELIDALRAIDQLAQSADEILEYLARGDEVRFFYRWQVQEERLKASLILRGGSWLEVIDKAERHGYFNGQIEFLLKFSVILDYWLMNKDVNWSEDEEASFLAAFVEYYEKSDAVFSSTGLRRFKKYEWERALLSYGDYTLSHTKNKSLLQDRVAGGNKRPTWKVLLRGRVGPSSIENERMLIKMVLDSVDLKEGIEASLEKVIYSSKVDEGWRRMMVKLPAAIEYCRERMFRKVDGGAVYLISKLRTSSEHVELWSFYLYQTLLTRMEKDGELKPFKRGYNSISGEDDVPSASLHWPAEDITLVIYYSDHSYRLGVKKKESDRRAALTDYLKQSYKISEQGQRDIVNLSEIKVEEVIRGLVSVARTFAS